MKRITMILFVVLLCAAQQASTPDIDAMSIKQLRELAKAQAMRIAELEIDNADLVEQLAEIERGGTWTQTGTSILQLLKIEQLPIDTTKQNHAAVMEKDAADLEAKAQQCDKQYAELADSRPMKITSGAHDVKSQLEHLRKTASGYRDSARGKLAEAAKLKREATVKRQRITGWDGARRVILETTRDLSGSLTNIEPRSFVSWSGRRIGLNNNTQVFSVTRIEKASKPNDFVDAS